MSEPATTYSTAVVNTMPDLDAATLLRMYLLQRKRALITELREVDKLLGQAQTVPKRERPR